MAVAEIAQSQWARGDVGDLLSGFLFNDGDAGLASGVEGHDSPVLIEQKQCRTGLSQPGSQLVSLPTPFGHAEVYFQFSAARDLNPRRASALQFQNELRN